MLIAIIDTKECRQISFLMFFVCVPRIGQIEVDGVVNLNATQHVLSAPVLALKLM